MRGVELDHDRLGPHDISGGSRQADGNRTQPVARDPGIQDSMDAQRTKQERSQDIRSQRAGGYLSNNQLTGGYLPGVKRG